MFGEICCFFVSLVILMQSGFSQTISPSFSSSPDATRAVCRATFSPGGGCIPLILAELEQATSRVDVAMFYFRSDALMDMPCKLSAKRGIAVRVLVDSDMDSTATRPVLEKLRDHGVSVYVVTPPGSGKLHHKCAVVDGKVVLTGSANWSEAGEQSNHEDVLALYSSTLGAKYLARFDEI